MQDGLECLVCTFVNPEGSTRCQMCTIEIGTRLEGRVPLERGTKIFAQESVQRDLSRRGGRDENVVLREVKILDQFGPDFKVLDTICIAKFTESQIRDPLKSILLLVQFVDIHLPPQRTLFYPNKTTFAQKVRHWIY